MNHAKIIAEHAIRALALCILALLLGCAAGVEDEMLAYADDIKARPGGRIEGLPQIKPYENFSYSADDVRSPASIILTPSCSFILTETYPIAS